MEQAPSRQNQPESARLKPRQFRTPDAKNPGLDLVEAAYLKDTGSADVPLPYGRSRPREIPRMNSGTFTAPKNREPEPMELSKDDILDVEDAANDNDRPEPLVLDDLEDLDEKIEKDKSIEMTEDDMIPTREIMPNPISRQQRRAEARIDAKQEARSAKKPVTKVEEAKSPVVKGKYATFLSSDLQKMMGRMDQIEGQVAELHKGHTELVDGHKAMEEKLLEELAWIREGLTLKDAPKPAARDVPTTRDEAITLVPKESWVDTLELTDLETLDNEPAPKRPKRKAETQPALEGRALLESLANKHGILLSEGARATRQEELVELASSHDKDIRRLKLLRNQLTEDEETLSNHPDIDPGNQKSLEERMKETRKTINQLSKECDPITEELDTYETYPTALQEVEFNLKELVEEIDRTNPNNKIRLQQLKNNFADFERMRDLLKEAEPKVKPASQESSKPWGWEFGKTAAQLGRELDIVLDPEERAENIKFLRSQIDDTETTLAENELKKHRYLEAASTHANEQIRRSAAKRAQRAEQNIARLEQVREDLTNEYSDAGAQPTAEDEIRNRLRELGQRAKKSPEDKKEIEVMKAKLERLLKTLSSTQEQARESTEEVNIDLDTLEELEGENFEESRLDRDKLVDEFGDDDEARD